jgi:ureidoacrylate peracid hydrolase
MSSIEPEHQSFNPEEFTLEEILKPEHCALMVIDLQNDFLHPEGFFANHLNQPVGQMQSTLPYIRGLIDSAHAAKVPVIFTKGHEDIKYRKGPDLRRAVKWDERPNSGSINSEEGTFGANFYEIEPGEDDIVIEKHKWSSFDGKDSSGRTLKEILDELGIRTLVVTGVTAETCVETTIRDAYGQDYFIVIPEHSVGSNDAQQLEARMKYWKGGHIGDVVDEEEIKQNWPPTEK